MDNIAPLKRWWLHKVYHSLMIEDGVLVNKAMPFDELMRLCFQIEDHINRVDKYDSIEIILHKIYS